MRVLAILLLLGCHLATGALAQQPPRAEWAGRWLADARLFDRHLRALAAPLPAELFIADDHTLHGTVGDATLPRTRPHSVTTKQVLYRITLDRPVRDVDGLKKGHMVTIITPGSGPVLDAEFHLKAHFGFDPTMRVGHFDAKQAE